MKTNRLMQIVRFSRTMGVDMGDSGIKVRAMTEVKIPGDYDYRTAQMAIVHKGEGKMTVQITPQPAYVEILQVRADQVPMDTPVTQTEAVSVSEAIEDQIEDAEQRAIDLLTPPQAQERSLKGRLMGEGPVKVPLI